MTQAQAVIETIDKFKEEIKETGYYCSIGYAFRSNKQQTITELFKEAERRMYEDKAEFYKNSPFERRKA